MTKILLLSTPLHDQRSGITLLDEPKSVHGLNDYQEKIRKIEGLQDQFWRSVGGVIWNPNISKLPRNGASGFSVKIPESSSCNFSFVDGFNFPSDWTIEQKEEYIRLQLNAIISYTNINTLWLEGAKKWDSSWKR